MSLCRASIGSLLILSGSDTAAEADPFYALSRHRANSETPGGWYRLQNEAGRQHAEKKIKSSG
jgi:hypothetical protein